MASGTRSSSIPRFSPTGRANDLCNTILDRSGAPAYTWLLCLMYVCFLLNNTWCESIGDVPIRLSTGSTGRATSLQHALENVLECDLTSPLYQSVLQHFGGDEDKFNVIDYFLCNQAHFWEPVYYKLDDSDFPSDSREKRGHFVGISESVGHAMTFKILTDDTLKVIHRSNVRSALNPHDKNL